MRKHKKFRKHLSLLLALALVFFTACGSGRTDGAAAGGGEDSGTESAAGGDFVIVTVPKVTAAAWFVRMEDGVVRFAQDTGVDAYMTGPAQADAAQQAQYIQDLIAAEVDAICVVPFSTEALEPVLKQARDAGIVVITHEGEGMVNIDYNIEAFDNTEYGTHLMERIALTSGGEGEYIVTVGALTSASHNQWVDSGIAHAEANYPGLSMYGDKIETNDLQDEAYEKVAEVLKVNPGLAGIQGSAMGDIAGASRAVEEANLSGQVTLVGTSLVSVSGKYIEEGTIDMISFWDPADAGYAMNALALMLLTGQEVGDGLNLGIEGYENLTLEGNCLYGQAWIDVDASNVDDPQYDF